MPQVARPVSYGDAMVSTGTLRHDKRGGPAKPFSWPTLNVNDNNRVAMAA